MFTPEGELREEFRHLQEPSADGPNDSSGAVESPTTNSVAPTAQAEESPAQPAEHAAEPEPGAPAFIDLVRLLAEHASIYLAEARGAGPQAAAQNLDLARLHIDLLAVLQEKTRGNLAPQEEAMLEDAIYQLRAGFVGVRG